MKKIIGVLSISVILLSCNNYYKALTVTKPGKGYVTENLNQSNKYPILRNGGQAYAMKNISFTPDSQYIQCNLTNLPEEHKLHLTNGKKGKMVYSKAGADDADVVILNEVHYFQTPDISAVPGPYQIPFINLNKMEILEKDKKRTATNHAVSGLLITGGSLLFLGLVFAMSLARGFSF